jgi:hypothetical protein
MINRWGDCNFKFNLTATWASNETAVNKHGDVSFQNKSLYQASILNAEGEEPNNPGIKIPLKCKWFRIRANEEVLIREISSNVY